MNGSHINTPAIADAADYAASLAERIKVSMESLCIDANDFEVVVKSKSTGEAIEKDSMHAPLTCAVGQEISKILKERSSTLLSDVRLNHVRRIVDAHQKLERMMKILFELPDVQAVLPEARRLAGLNGG